MIADSIAILIAEDEVLIRMAAADYFRDQGIEVIEASSAAQALKKAKGRTKLCALFTDVEMPGFMNGIALAHSVREWFPGAVIVICSGKTLPYRDALPDGARFIAKPYSTDDLKLIAEELCTSENG